jgi:hypothetical protein
MIAVVWSLYLGLKTEASSQQNKAQSIGFGGIQDQLKVRGA